MNEWRVVWGIRSRRWRRFHLVFLRVCVDMGEGGRGGRGRGLGRVEEAVVRQNPRLDG